jgi:hypothetical protein
MTLMGNGNPCYFLTLTLVRKITLALSCNVVTGSKHMKSIFLNEIINKPIIKMIKLVVELCVIDTYYIFQCISPLQSNKISKFDCS